MLFAIYQILKSCPLLLRAWNWILSKSQYEKTKKEELIKSIELFRKYLEPTGKFLDSVKLYFSEIQSKVKSHFPELMNLQTVADSHYGQYQFHVGRMRPEANNDHEISKTQIHSGLLMDITADMLSILSGRNDRRYQKVETESRF